MRASPVPAAFRPGSVDFHRQRHPAGHVALVNGAASLTTGRRRWDGAHRESGTVSPRRLPRRVRHRWRARSPPWPRRPLPLRRRARNTATSGRSRRHATGICAARRHAGAVQIGTLVVGTANFVWDAAAGVARARYTGPLVEPTYTATGGALKPGPRRSPSSITASARTTRWRTRRARCPITREDAAVAYAGDANVRLHGVFGRRGPVTRERQRHQTRPPATFVTPPCPSSTGRPAHRRSRTVAVGADGVRDGSTGRSISGRQRRRRRRLA